LYKNSYKLEFSQAVSHIVLVDHQISLPNL